MLISAVQQSDSVTHTHTHARTHTHTHTHIYILFLILFHYGSDGKESACSAGDLGSILGSGRSPGEGIHSNILAEKITWMEEPDRLQSMGLQRVGHN